MPKKLVKMPSASAAAAAPDAAPVQAAGPTPPDSKVDVPQEALARPAAPQASRGPGPPPILRDGLPLPRMIVFDLDYTLWPFWVDTHVAPPLRPAPPTSSHGGATDAVAALHAGITTAAVDNIGEEFRFFPDVPQILYLLPLAGIKLAVASRTSTPDRARALLRILHVPIASVEATALNGSADGNNTAAGGGTGGGTTARPSLASSGSNATLTKRDTRARRAVDFFDGGLEMYPGRKLQHMNMIQRRTGVPFTEMLFFDDESRNREVEQLGVTMWLVRDGVSWGEVEKGIQAWRARRALAAPA